MTTNSLRAICAQQPAFGTWCAVPAAFSAEIAAHAGADYVCVDCQHGLIGYDSAVAMLHAMSRTGTTPVVRVPWNDPAWIAKVLDAGAEAVIIPMVNDADDARRAVAAGSFPPLGHRSWSATRISMFLGTEPEHVNAEVMRLAMIETRQGLENADAICATEGIDGIYIGPADLAISFGYRPGLDPRPAEVEEAISLILGACQRHGVVPGIHAGSGPAARHYADQGFRMLTVGADVAWLQQGVRESLADARGTSTGS